MTEGGGPSGGPGARRGDGRAGPVWNAKPAAGRPAAGFGLRYPHFLSRQIIGSGEFDPSCVIRAAGEGSALSRSPIPRHPGECRDPAVKVLPLFSCFARCRERVTFLCLCTASLAARTAKPTRRASVAGASQEKITKRKHTPSVAPDAARRVHGLRGVFRQHIHVLIEKRAASCRAPFGPDPRSPSRPGAPADQDQNRLTDVIGT
jgi:hypothetical protein